MHLSRQALVAAGVATVLLGGGTATVVPFLASKVQAVTTWAATQAPLPANADHTFAQLSSVACPTAFACTAVGSYTSAAGWRGLLVSKSGSSWTALQAPLPAGAAADPYATLGSVACASASMCAAIGFYQDSSNARQGLLLTGSGSSWTAAQAPLPGGAAVSAYPRLASVACNSASSTCVVVGSYQDTSGHYQGLLLTGFGSSWTASQAPLPAGFGAYLYSVKCTAGPECTAVGDYYDGSGNTQGLLLTGYGSSWTATEAPLPADAGPTPDAVLSAVACSSSSLCTAVGTYNDGGRGLLLTGSGTSWTATEAPLPPGAQVGDANLQLPSVTCPVTSGCTAVGSYTPPADGLLLTGTGSSWTATQAPLPGNAAMDPETALKSVACTSGTCLAAGSYATASNKYAGLLISGASSSWSAIEIPLPSNGRAGPSSPLSAVACAKSTSACIAVGYYIDQYGNDQGLLLTGPP